MSTPSPPSAPPLVGARRGRGDAGFTLIELTVAMAIMALAFAIVGTTLVSAANTSGRLNATSSAVDQIRLASDRLDRDLRSAACIIAPAEGQSGNTLVFQTLSNGIQSQVTYQVSGARLTRRLDLQPEELVISSVAATGGGFSQGAGTVGSLRSVVVDVPISSNGSVVRLQTTITGRNAWRTC